MIQVLDNGTDSTESDCPSLTTSQSMTLPAQGMSSIPIFSRPLTAVSRPPGGPPTGSLVPSLTWAQEFCQCEFLGYLSRISVPDYSTLEGPRCQVTAHCLKWAHETRNPRPTTTHTSQSNLRPSQIQISDPAIALRNAWNIGNSEF